MEGREYILIKIIMNDTIKMIIMEELDISPSEFNERFMNGLMSVGDNIIKKIAIKCYNSNKWIFSVTSGSSTITPYWSVKC